MTASTTPQTAAAQRRLDRSRRHDLVLWGATGFTGKLVAEYLTRHYLDADLRWALAGRSEPKLAALRQELGRIDERAAELPILTADSHDGPSLDRLTEQTQVVCSTVGPYAKHGSELVAACVRNDTDYCDITGEVAWVRAMIDEHHQAARAAGTRIVPCCGYDSIPSDLGCLMVQRHAQRQLGGPCRSVTTYAGKTRGGFSGGTIASMLYAFEQMRGSESVQQIMADPYSLNPPDERSGPDEPDSMGIAYDRDAGIWTGPFIMAAVNARVVRRTNALLEYEYGRDFRYREVTGFAAGLGGLTKAGGAAASLAGFGALLAIPPTRALLRRYVLPAPGQGPDRARRERGFFEMQIVGRTTEATIRGRVAGPSDPGYGETSKMLAESAVCLAREGADLDAAGGVLTPAACMGDHLLERLRRAEMTFAIE